MSEIDLSPIIDNMETLVFNLFRAWTAEVEKIKAEESITIDDERILVRDFTDSITVALKSLKEKEEKIPGWEIGFFYGFTRSHLNHHWCHEYILKKSNDYRMIVMLQALQKYLMVNDGHRLEIGEIYKKNLLGNCNFQESNIVIRATLDAVKMQMEIPEIARIQQNLDDSLMVSIDNLITEKILWFANLEEEMYLPDLQTYISEDDVLKLIKNNLE